MILNKMCWLVVGLLVFTTVVPAQNYSSSRSRSRARIGTAYFNNYNRNAYNPYNQIGYGGSPYQLSPYLRYSRVATPTPAVLPPVSGPIERYSPVEYGEIVQMALEAARKNDPGTGSIKRPTIVEVTTSTEGLSLYKPVATGVSDILDRGIFLLPTGEELRMRGVNIPSNTEKNDTSRLYSREAIQVLRNLVTGKEIYIILDDPLRDSSGRLLGTVLLADGTELNRRMIELGYGAVNENDFSVDVDFSDMNNAMAGARTRRIGIWSGKF